MTDMDQLFDIFCFDEKRRELENLNQLRMTSKDFNSHADQKGPRLMECMEIVEPLSVSDLTFKQIVLTKSQQTDSTEMEVASSSLADLSDTDSQSSSLMIASTALINSLHSLVVSRTEEMAEFSKDFWTIPVVWSSKCGCCKCSIKGRRLDNRDR